jgi:FeS assembly SUF system protein
MDDNTENGGSEPGSGGDLKNKVIEVLRTCYDPEIPVDIYELGLVYNINVDPSGDVIVTMTLTSPGCPVAGTLPVEVEDKVMALDGVGKARVDIVWDPPWTPDRMTDAARLTLGMM